MSIEDEDDRGTLDVDHGRQAGAGPRDRLHVRAVRPSVAAPQAVGDHRLAASDGLREVPVEVLERAAGYDQAGPEASQTGARRDDHTCRHCGDRVLTRNSRAMWGHWLDGAECSGSRTWNH
jgi:hypothetical protein